MKALLLRLEDKESGQHLKTKLEKRKIQRIIMLMKVRNVVIVGAVDPVETIDPVQVF